MFVYFSPLEQFHVKGLINVTAPNITDSVFSLTNLGFYIALVTYLIVSMHIVTIYDKEGLNLISDRFSIAIESSFSSIHSIVKSQIGSKVKCIYHLCIHYFFSF